MTQLIESLTGVKILAKEYHNSIIFHFDADFINFIEITEHLIRNEGIYSEELAKIIYDKKKVFLPTKTTNKNEMNYLLDNKMLFYRDLLLIRHLKYFSNNQTKMELGYFTCISFIFGQMFKDEIKDKLILKINSELLCKFVYFLYTYSEYKEQDEYFFKAIDNYSDTIKKEFENLTVQAKLHEQEDHPITAKNYLLLANNLGIIIETLTLFYKKISRRSNLENLKESYEKPWSYEQIENELGKDKAEELMNDPVHKFRIETGIELIHKEPSLDEFNRIVKNWKLLTPSQKIKSDIKSIELFGIPNEQRIEEILNSYKHEKVYIESLSYLKQGEEELNKIKQLKGTVIIKYLALITILDENIVSSGLDKQLEVIEKSNYQFQNSVGEYNFNEKTTYDFTVNFKKMTNLPIFLKNKESQIFTRDNYEVEGGIKEIEDFINKALRFKKFKDKGFSHFLLFFDKSTNSLVDNFSDFKTWFNTVGKYDCLYSIIVPVSNYVYKIDYYKAKDMGFF